MTFNCKSTTAASVQPKKLKSIPKMEGRTGHDGFSQWCTMYTIIQKWFTIISEWWLRFSRVILNSSANFKIKTLPALWLCWIWFCCRGQLRQKGAAVAQCEGKLLTGQPPRGTLASCSVISSQSRHRLSSAFRGRLNGKASQVPSN